MRTRFGVFAAALALATAGCGENDKDGGASNTTASPTATGNASPSATASPPATASGELDGVATCLEQAGVEFNRAGGGPGGLKDSLLVILVEEDTAGGVFLYDSEENARKAEESSKVTVTATDGDLARIGTTVFWYGNSKAHDTFAKTEECVKQG